MVNTTAGRIGQAGALAEAEPRNSAGKQVAIAANSDEGLEGSFRGAKRAVTCTTHYLHGSASIDEHGPTGSQFKWSGRGRHHCRGCSGAGCQRGPTGGNAAARAESWPRTRVTATVTPVALAGCGRRLQ